MAIDFEKINETPHLLDILLQMEDVLDSLDLYVFKNWYHGEVVEGPLVRRYWFDLTLRFEMSKMPDPRGALRLLRHGLRIDYSKVTVGSDGISEPIETIADTAMLGEAECETNAVETEQDVKPTHWEVRVSIPRRLVSDMNAGELDFYDDEIEVEDVQDAQDSGMDEETAYSADDAQGDNDTDASPEEEPDDALKF